MVAVLIFVALASLTVVAWAAEARGRVKGVFPDRREIVVSDSTGKDWTFTLAKDGKVVVNGADSKLADLQPGDMVEVTHESQAEKLVASQIRCKRD
jgi:hypothetical protein